MQAGFLAQSAAIRWHAAPGYGVRYPGKIRFKRRNMLVDGYFVRWLVKRAANAVIFSNNGAARLALLRVFP